MRFRLAVAVAVGLVVTLSACSTSSAPVSSQTAVSAPTVTSTIPAGSLAITGEVTKPTTFTVAQLAAMTSHTVTVSFGGPKGIENHTEMGPYLTDVLAVAGLKTDPATKNDKLRLCVAAVGSDGYTAVVSYGEIDPNFGNRLVVVSVNEDNKTLDTEGPRLVVPGDAKGGRYMAGVVRLIVGRAQP